MDQTQPASHPVADAPVADAPVADQSATAPGAGPTRSDPDRVHTPLLQLVTLDALDSDYSTVASRRPHLAQRRRRTSGGTLAALLAFGLLIAMAAVQTNKQADVESAERNELIRRVEAQRTALEGTQQSITDLQETIATLTARSTRLRNSLEEELDRQEELGISIGFVGVRGPGVKVTIDDAPGSGSAGDGIVRDTDLRLAINALWQAGAEAIAVNGRRISALSVPRNSGSVIRLDSVSLSPPYIISAVGDPDNLGQDFADTESGLQFLAIAQNLSMPVSISDADDLVLPPAPDRLGTLDHAVEIKPLRPEGDML